MSHHLVVGAGPVGRATARRLAEQGQDVRLVSRSGAGPELPGVRRAAADAADADRLSQLAAGAAVLYNCVNPPDYARWPQQWPPIAQALLTAAERSGAVLVTTGNLYPYGPVEGPFTEGLPDAATGSKARLRARMWADALAAHRAGRVRAAEVRASDYVGDDDVQGHLNRALARLLTGRSVRVLGSADQPHSWTYVPDVARCLVAVAADELAWGRVWHVPTAPPHTQREALLDIAGAARVEPGRISVLPHLVLLATGVAVPTVRALEETRYQFTGPWVLDSSAAQRELDLAPTPWDEVCARVATWGLERHAARSRAA